jgi:hypothetical protein
VQEAPRAASDMPGVTGLCMPLMNSTTATRRPDHAIRACLTYHGGLLEGYLTPDAVGGAVCAMCAVHRCWAATTRRSCWRSSQQTTCRSASEAAACATCHKTWAPGSPWRHQRLPLPNQEQPQQVLQQSELQLGQLWPSTQQQQQHLVSWGQRAQLLW